MIFLFIKKPIRVDELYNYDEQYFHYEKSVAGLNRLKWKCEVCNQGPSYKIFATMMQHKLFFIPIIKMHEDHVAKCNYCDNEIRLEDSEVKALTLLKAAYMKERD